MFSAVTRAKTTISAFKLFDESKRWLRDQVESGKHDKYIVHRGRKFNYKINPKLQSANHVRVFGYDNGMLANVLQVLDALMFKDPDATIDVDWGPRDGFKDFTYGHPPNLWLEIFEPLSEDIRPGALFEMRQRVNPLFVAPSRELYFRNKKLFKRHRLAYGSHAQRIRIADKDMLAELQSFEAMFAETRSAGGAVIGVHFRTLSRHVVVAQAVPPASIKEMMADILEQRKEGDLVFVATDDADFIGQLEGQLDRGLVTRDVSRVSNASGPHSDSEAHRLDATLQDAKDVILDDWLLSKCDMLMHNTDSNLVLTAAILNPDLKLTHVASKTQKRLKFDL